MSQRIYTLQRNENGKGRLNQTSRPHPAPRDAMLIPVLNCMTSVFAGFVIYSVLGFLAHEMGVEVAEVRQAIIAELGKLSRYN